ncbi:MAG TPA: lytic transglycosylase domain-containing protein [Terriglobales bacterium]|jgi:soluble lytic murein transglycosylase-like protein|nr:lytic transglycosylase domain-containing protein [Terriglobales bacterium]
MRKRLKIALMTAAIATFLSLAPDLSAASNATIMASTDDSGHTVYVNDSVASSSRRASQRELGSAAPSTFRSQRDRLVFWSTTEHRWKTVPHANVRAARSAAAEVDQYLDKPESQQNSPVRQGFTQKEIEDAISKAAERHAVDPNLVRALVKVESNFNPNAVSRKGAMGLMQLMPQTARQMKLTNPFNPEENVDAGVRHLKDLLDSYGGDVRLSLAAYNAGAGAVARSSGIPHYAETRNYVKRITQLYGGSMGNNYFLPSASREPVRVQRDVRGVLYISNTD